MITHLRHRPPGGHRVAEDHEHRPTWWFVLIGAVGGLWLGGVARVWMRSISVDPEFSWGGTIAILMSFTLFGAAQSAAGVARRRRSPVGTIAAARSLAIVLSLGLFGAAGAIMFPTVVFGSLAVWRTDWSKPIRGLLRSWRFRARLSSSLTLLTTRVGPSRPSVGWRFSSSSTVP